MQLPDLQVIEAARCHAWRTSDL